MQHFQERILMVNSASHHQWTMNPSTTQPLQSNSIHRYSQRHCGVMRMYMYNNTHSYSEWVHDRNTHRHGEWVYGVKEGSMGVSLDNINFVRGFDSVKLYSCSMCTCTCIFTTATAVTQLYWHVFNPPSVPHLKIVCTLWLLDLMGKQTMSN